MIEQKLKSIIEKACINENQADMLLDLVIQELEPVLKVETRSFLGDTPRTQAKEFGDLARLVRRTGEMPTYFAILIALWFYYRGIGAENVKEAAIKECGLSFEREFSQLVWEAQIAFPNLPLDEENLKKARLMKQAYRLGYEYENKYRGCAQCTFAAICDTLNLDNPEVFRAANGFAAGVGLMGDGICGGYSGGILSMGLKAGRRREFFDGDKEEKDLITKMAQKLREKFILTYNSLICHGIHREIFGRVFHLTVKEEKEAFEEAGAHTIDKCAAVVGAAAAWTVEIMYEHKLLKK